MAGRNRVSQNRMLSAVYHGMLLCYRLPQNLWTLALSVFHFSSASLQSYSSEVPFPQRYDPHELQDVVEPQDRGEKKIIIKKEWPKPRCNYYIKAPSPVFPFIGLSCLTASVKPFKDTQLWEGSATNCILLIPIQGTYRYSKTVA